ncbi:pentatricopeptide repeat-containing protein DOT4, chloroplastic-like [Primulina eburnea]|uniref:pentatricopeptide repeat-containing protein DOT4, chloroplastic-like n=1 Tax=Primulina eburnea TaxID=1245227 RepID=UPI003C6C8E8B
MSHALRCRVAHQLFEAITVRGPASSQVTANRGSRSNFPLKSPNLVDPFEYFNENDVPKSWASKISSLVRENQPREAIRVFKSILVNRRSSNFVTVLSVIKAVGLIRSKDMVFGIHGYAIKVGCIDSEVSVVTALVGVYSSFDMGNAWKLFNQTANRDVVLWSAMVSACVSNGEYLEAFKLLKEMVFFGVQPNHVTVASILPVCAGLGALNIGKEIHDHCIKKVFYTNTVFQNSLLGMYSRCGDLKAALLVFNDMQNKDIVSWRIVIHGCVENDSPRQALELFLKFRCSSFEKVDEFIILEVIGAYSELVENFIRNGFHSLVLKTGFTGFVFVVTELLRVYAKFGYIESARSLFDQLDRKDLIAWSAMISVYAQSSRPNDAFDLLRQMQLANQKPNEFSYVSLLQACISINAIEIGESIQAQIIKDGYSNNTFIMSSLIDMYCRFGKVRQGESIFSENFTNDFMCWSSMINGYAINGCGEEVLECFSNMLSLGIEPNDIIFISVLSSCSHSGLEYEGWNWFYAMEETYGIRPNLAHYACMVDMLSRQGNVEEALEFVYKMPIQPDKRIWGALLAGVQNTRGNIDILELVVEKLNSLDPENTSYLVVLSNLYAEHGRWEEVEKLRNMIDNKSLKKIMGYTTVLS